MVEELLLRKQVYNKIGICNIYGKRNKLKFFLIFIEENIWVLVDKFNIEICKIYYDQIIDGEFVEGEKRIGCVYCGFGIQYEDLENNKFICLRKREFKRWVLFMDKLGFRRVLSFIGLKFED